MKEIVSASVRICIEVIGGVILLPLIITTYLYPTLWPASGYYGLRGEDSNTYVDDACVLGSCENESDQLTRGRGLTGFNRSQLFYRLNITDVWPDILNGVSLFINLVAQSL